VLCFDRAMEPQRIEHLDDPRVADYRNLRDATLARERDRFIVEGRGNLFVLLERSPLRPASLLLSERAWRVLADRIRASGVDGPLYLASQDVLDGIAGFSIHRGVLASCARPEPVDALALARRLAEHARVEGGRPPRLLVLEGLTNPDNVGGVFRNAMGLGGDAVLLCPRTCDPLYRKAIRTSMGGALCVPFARSPDLGGLLRGLKDAGYRCLAFDPAPAGRDLATLDPRGLGPAAIVLGTEGDGLTRETLAASDLRVRIAMEPGVDSLNVAVASAIELHRLRVESSGQPGSGRGMGEGERRDGA
jgi:tRNA G18 (ribose-2'-O)-methylase SpoU